MIKIYDDNIIDYVYNYKKDIIASLKDNDIIVNDENIQAEAQAWIDSDAEYLKEIITHYDNYYDNNIIYIDASLGLWYGRKKAHKTVTSLYSGIFSLIQDVNTLYFMRKNGALTLKAIHHDGVNYFKFYRIVDGKKYAIKYDDIYNI